MSQRYNHKKTESYWQQKWIEKKIFESSANPVKSDGGFTGTVDTTFTDSKVNPTGSKVISLDTEFTSGLSIPEINKGTGDIIYIDNRPLISRNARQKEDIKVILPRQPSTCITQMASCETKTPAPAIFFRSLDKIELSQRNH